MGVLDQMTVTNISDQEALDDFLNSTVDDISTGSSLTSGDPNSVTLQPEDNSRNTVAAKILSKFSKLLQTFFGQFALTHSHHHFLAYEVLKALWSGVKMNDLPI